MLKFENYGFLFPLTEENELFPISLKLKTDIFGSVFQIHIPV
jgi:hypothetical protein